MKSDRADYGGRTAEIGARKTPCRSRAAASRRDATLTSAVRLSGADLAGPEHHAVGAL
jgi:hypothetical protein